jgi:peptidoglycan/LPS O-acetylase OafA/YrhL
MAGPDVSRLTASSRGRWAGRFRTERDRPRPAELEANARVGEVAHPRLTYRPELDGIRAIAVLMVLANHVRFSMVGSAGRTGVALFFVLSGYLITSLLIAERERTGRIDFRRFYERRVRRLMPAAIALLVMTSAVAYVLQWPDYPPKILAALFYASNLAWSFGIDMHALSHTWSLAVEEQFYLLWPVTFVLLGRRAVPWLVVALVAVIVIRPFTVGDTPATLLRTDIRIDAVIAGCLLAFVPWQPGRWLALVGVGVVILAALVEAPFAVQFTLDTIGSVLVVAGASSIPGLSWRPLVRVGEISYGLYLWHALPIAVLWPAIEAGAPIAQAAVIVSAFALALVSERFVERRFRSASGVRGGIEQGPGAVGDVAVGERAVDVHHADEHRRRDRPAGDRRDAPVARNADAGA